MFADPHSEAYQAAMRAVYPVVRSRELNLWIGAGVEALNASQSFAGTQVLRDRLRVVRARIDFDAADGLDGSTVLSVEFSQGLPILDASESSDPLRSRVDGRSEFTKIEMSATRQQGLGDAFALQLDMAAQKSFDPLLSPEESLSAAPASGAPSSPLTKSAGSDSMRRG